MEYAIVGFALGVWWCQQQAVLPAWPVPALLAVLLGGLMWHWRRPLASGLVARVLVLSLCFLVGLAYAGWRAELRLADRLAPSLEGVDLSLRGQVVDLPQPFERGLRFRFAVEDPPPGVPGLLALSWYRQGDAALPPLRAGSRWQFTLRLRRVHGSLNPHGFDYEAWALERGLGATGYVRPQVAPQLLAPLAGGVRARVDHWRGQVRDRFARVLGDSPQRGILVALVVGDQASISRAQWDLFARTGVTHLMSISGLHVTLIASLLALLVGWGWRRVPALALRLPAQKAAILAAAAAAGAYVVIAGFGVPAQRTFYMLLVVAAALWLGRGAQAARCLLSAALLVLLIDPWAVLAAGFWLSFGAVAALFLMGSGWGRAHWSWNWLRAQWAVSLFTLPLLLGLFHKFSLISPLANALAIPLVSLVVTPLALVHAVLPLPFLARLGDWLLAWLLRFLEFCAELPFALWQQAAPPGWLVLLCCLAAAWALLPRGVPGRWAGLLCFVALVVWTPLRPAPGQFRATVLDVGQGLAVHVQTARHDLLFDAGPRYSGQASAGERVLLPYLVASGVQRVQSVMLSHQDSDHAGGAESLQAGIAIQRWQGSLPLAHALRSLPGFQPCEQGQGWEWDGVRFAVLHPLPGEALGGNAASCVLRVGEAGRGLLLTGDITLRAEAALIARAASELPAAVLVAPHHGSLTSSSEDFIAAVGAQHVVFTAGYRNRFDHPAPAVVERYRASGARLHRSDADGALRFDFAPDVAPQVRTSRAERRRYWHE